MHLGWQTPAFLGVKKLFIWSKPFAIYYSRDRQTWIRILSLAGYALMKIKAWGGGATAVGNCNSITGNFTEGFPIYRREAMHVLADRQHRRASALLPICGFTKLLTTLVCLPRPRFLLLLHWTLRTGSDNEQPSPRGTISFLMCLIWSTFALVSGNPVAEWALPR